MTAMDRDTAGRLRLVTEIVSALGFWGGLGLMLIVGWVMFVVSVANHEITVLFGARAVWLVTGPIACLGAGTVAMVSCPNAPDTAAYRSQWLRFALVGLAFLLLGAANVGMTDWTSDTINTAPSGNAPLAIALHAALPTLLGGLVLLCATAAVCIPAAAWVSALRWRRGFQAPEG